MSFSSWILGKSPLLYWRLGESSDTTVVDSSGNSRNGTYTGSPTLGTAGLVPGDSDTAVTFDGTNDKAEIAYASWMDVGSALTVVAVIDTTAATGEIMARYTNNPVRLWEFRVQSNKLQFIKIAGGTTTATSSASVNDGNPHLVVATYDGANTRLYIDGAADGTAAGTGNLSGQNPRFVVGERAADLRYTGIMDEVVMFGTVLSAADIADMYDAFLGSVTVAGDAFASAATMLDGSALTAISVAGDAFVSAATFLDGSAGGSPITVSGEAFAAVATMLDGSALTAISVAGDVFVSSATMLDGAPVLGPVGGDAFAAIVAMLDGGVVVSSATDTSNFYNGRRRGGLATVELDVPVTAPPVAATVVRVDKAIALPQPVLVKGRPT